MAWSKDRCCVAIPLYNVGIYAILAQFAIIALVTAVLSFAAPTIVAVAIPSFGSYILGAASMLVFGLQAWGFFGVYKEKPATFRKYVAVNTAALALAFILALVWIIVSAVKHTSAVDACIEQFITEDSGTNSNQSEVNVTSGSVSGETLCNIFTWVQMGVMGGLWLALLLVEFYFALMCRFYQTEQREDHKRYNSIYTEQRETIMRQSGAFMWENGRVSSDGDPNLPPGAPGLQGGAHGRSFSAVSRSSALRNEFKPDGEGDADRSYTAHGDESLGHIQPDGYLDAPLYSSPTKHSNASTSTDRYPASHYSASHAHSRSNLAPLDSNPAYMHSRDGSALGGQQQYGRYEHNNDTTDDFAGYYTR